MTITVIKPALHLEFWLVIIFFAGFYASPCRGALRVISASAGGSHSLFVLSDGSLWAMGNNSNGQLGDGTTTNRNYLVRIMSSNAVAVAAGFTHSLVLKSDGTLWAMGANGNGQLGDGTTTDQHSPEEIIYNGGVTAMAAGGFHSLFLKTNSLWGMGANDQGQLGTGNSVEIHGASQLIPGGISAISAGYRHSMFITNDGSVYAMGWNVLDQLGDNSMKPKLYAGGNLHQSQHLWRRHGGDGGIQPWFLSAPGARRDRQFVGNGRRHRRRPRRWRLQPQRRAGGNPAEQRHCCRGRRRPQFGD